MTRLARWSLCACLAYAAPAAAQTTLAGWALDRAEPAPAGDGFFLAERPWYGRGRSLAVGLTLGYASGLLGLTVPRDGLAPRDEPVVSGMFSGQLAVSFAPLDRLGLHLALPVSFAQSGLAVPAGLGNLGPSSGPAAGDVRVGVRVRLAGDADRDAASIHVGALAWIPTGSAADNTGDDAARFEPRVVLAGRVGRLRWSLGVGLHLRRAVSALNLAVGSELRGTAAVGVTLLRGRLHGGLEASLFSALRDLPSGRGNAAFTPGHWGVELLLGPRWNLAPNLQLAVAAGIGLGDGYGVPAGRALFSLTYCLAPSPSAPRPIAPTLARPAAPPPVSAEPVVAEPVVAEPVVAEPVVAEPVVAEPVVADDASSHPLAAVSGGFVRTLRPVEFRAHLASVHGARSLRVLDAVATILRAAAITVDVQVHSGHRSRPAFYRALSARRAAVVREALIARGVPGARLLAHGQGADCIDGSGDDSPRVQFVIVATGEQGGRCVDEPPTPPSRHRHPR